MSIIASLAVLSLAASSASAITLTPSCISTLTTTLSASPASECFATNALLKVLPIALNGSQTLVPFVDNYLTAVCLAPTCSNETTRATVQSLVGGCGEVFASFGLKNETIDKYTPFIPQLKDVGCLSTTNATEAWNYTAPAGDMSMNMTANASMPSANSSVYCLPSILNAVEQISGKPLTFSVITSLLNKEMSLSSFINGTSISNSSELLCTDCTKGMIVQIEKFTNGTQFMMATNNKTGSFIADVKKFVSGVCGEQFLTNGSLPATVMDGSNKNETSTSGPKTGAAVSSFSLNTGVVVAFAGVVGAMLI